MTLRGGLTGCIVLLALAGCERQDPAEKAASDARDVAMVEAAQARKPPPVPIAPQPITFGDVEANNLFGAGCAFRPEGATDTDPVLYADGTRAVLKLDGELVVLASDTGSGELPYAAREHYSGKALDLRLAKGAGEGEVASEESMRWPGSITVHDRFERPVYAAKGTLECGA